MRKALSAPFFFEAGQRAVLLLHGFTGSSADVRMLGRFLEKKGYTSHAPHYKGHGVPPEQLINSTPAEWWTDVVAGYNMLKGAGYEEIAVIGLSLGGVFSLKLGLDAPVKGIITMCAPMTMRTTDIMFEGVLQYAKQYKIQEGKSEQEIEIELAAIRKQGMASLPELQQLISDVRNSIDLIYAPLFVVQSRKDEIIDPLSAHTIYGQVESLDKHIKWFEHSGHVITLDKEKDQLHEDIHQFLETLDWTV
ncbi:alpha/beta hydrolase [Solibacillus sp. FSL H8-0538]|uniref:alpha/beta hydrolase n=1 Tax=Solibacillus sp. FSL H8-0538 TaxID=2921400 RepID=UPI0030F95220